MKVTCIDVETTGLIKNISLPLDKQPKVIEFCAMNVDLLSGKKGRPFNVFIDPGEKIEPVITKITGIEQKDLDGEPSFDHFAKKIMRILQGTAGVSATVAHNMSFDKDMLDIEFKRLGKRIKWKRPVCTIQQTMHIKGFRLNQQALHEHLFGHKFKGAHRAISDVHALADICVELYSRGMLK